MSGLGTLGTTRLGQQEEAPQGSPVTPEPTSGGVLLTGDNGLMDLHTSPSTDKVVWTGSRGTHGYEDEIVAFGASAPAYNTPKIITTMVAQGDPHKPIYSTDGGNHWTLGSATAPSGYSAMDGVGKDGVYSWNVDEDGIVWLLANKTSDSHKWFLKATDQTATAYTPVFDATALGMASSSIGGYFISDGWIWGFQQGRAERWDITMGGGTPTSGAYSFQLNGAGPTVVVNYTDTVATIQASFDAAFGTNNWRIFSLNPATPHGVIAAVYCGNPFHASGTTFFGTVSNTLDNGAFPVYFKTQTDRPQLLLRSSTAGSSFLSTEIVGVNEMLAGTTVINGYHGSKRLVLWDTFNWGCKRVLSVDITNPGAPAYVWSSLAPFGGTSTDIPADKANLEARDVLPLTNQIIIANIVGTGQADPNAGLHGSIWRSTDGGSTWANVVADTTRLGEAASSGGAGSDNDLNAIAVNPALQNDVWVGLCPPYVYHSTDYGATWDYETVDMSVFDPYLAGGVRPQEWCGICIGMAASPPPTSGEHVIIVSLN